MTEQQELQAKIAAISGKINLAKQTPQHFATNPQYHGIHNQATYDQSGYHQAGRWAPYASTRGRGGRGGFQTLHRNRSLVLSGNDQPPADITNQPHPERSTDTDHANTENNVESHISKRGRHLQLINKATFEREQKQAFEQKRFEPVEQGHAIIRTTHTSTNIQTKSPPDHQRELEISGILFVMKPDGSKLTRVGCESRVLTEARDDTCELKITAPTDKPTPAKARIAGIDFFRTRNGNLARVKQKQQVPPANQPKRPQCENFTKHGTASSEPIRRTYRREHRLRGIPRRTFSGKLRIRTALTHLTGTCPFGPTCKFAHDPEQVAICKDFLRSGTCPTGTHCDMSHEATYHRVPACTHFLRGNCTNDACRYPHVNVSPSASVCRAFATLGYCAKGATCEDRHAFECPDYAEFGSCVNQKKGRCALPHIDRVSNMRKAAGRQALADSDEGSELSDAAQDSEIDFDLDAAPDIIMSSDEDEHQLTQQRDFVPFS